ncbi:hypothetical protein ACTL6U_16310 [Rhodovibrionaceae bacterium A322]
MKNVPVTVTGARAENRRRSLLITAGFLLLTVLAPVVLSISAPAAGQQRALVFAPGTHLPDVFAALEGTGARIVRANDSGSVVVAAFSEEQTLNELWKRGVLLTLDPWLAGGCSPIDVNA